jgi:hypothetical protein
LRSASAECAAARLALMHRSAAWLDGCALLATCLLLEIALTLARLLLALLTVNLQLIGL